MVERRFKNEEEGELTRLYEGGMTQAALAEKFHTSVPTVIKTLRRLGVKTRGPGPGKKSLTNDERVVMADLYRSDWSQDRIASHLGTSQTRVSRALRLEGVRTGRKHLEGQRHPRWKGGSIVVGGYRYQWISPDHPFASMAQSQGYVMEHRLKMAERLGRSLLPTETVHHKNGDKMDNDDENLQLRQGKHGDGVVMKCSDCGSLNVIPVSLD